MSTATRVIVVFVPLWVVLKVQEGGDNQKQKMTQSGNRVIGVIVILLAVVAYPTNHLVAFGVGVLGDYLLLGGKIK